MINLFIKKDFAGAAFNTVADLFDENGVLLSSEKCCSKSVPSTKYFQFIQVVNSIPQSWFKVIRISRNSREFCQVKENLSGLEIFKLTSSKIYWIFIQSVQTCPTSQKSFDEKLNLRHDELNWKSVYPFPGQLPLMNLQEFFSTSF